MSFHKLDTKGQPIPRKGRTKREPATREERGVTLYHYEVVVAVPVAAGKYQYKKRRYWLPDDNAADEAERALLHKPTAKALTWTAGYKLWLEGNKHSPGHLLNVARVIRQWTAAFGVNKTIEDTLLPEFSQYTEALGKSGKGRAGQIAHTELMAIARWCRKRGLVERLPFEHAPKPKARISKRAASPLESYYKLAEGMQLHLSLMWQVLGLTGMRLGAACDLVEADIGSEEFTVTTKGSKRVTYPITQSIRRIIEQARQWKRENGLSSAPTLFCNTVGGRWTPTTYGRHVKAACTSLNVEPPVTAHQLRHLAGTLMAEKNLSADIIQAGLGHSSRESAEDYIDQTRAMRAKALEVVDKILTKNDLKSDKTSPNEATPNNTKSNQTTLITCPCCGHKFNISK